MHLIWVVVVLVLLLVCAGGPLGVMRFAAGAVTFVAMMVVLGMVLYWVLMTWGSKLFY